MNIIDNILINIDKYRYNKSNIIEFDKYIKWKILDI